MARVASYGLYKCLSCGEINLRARWGTIGPRIPIDLGYSNDVSKTCFNCGSKKKITDYLLIGETRRNGDDAPIHWFLSPEDGETKKRDKIKRFFLNFFRKNKSTLHDYNFFKD